jgi:serine/threonine protein kinase/Tfp pilus assembly protein PilF
MALDPQRLKELFLSAAEITSPSERAAFLERECGDNAELRRKVEALLHAHDDSGGFLAPAPTGDRIPDEDASEHAQGGETVGDVIGPYKLLQKLGEGGMGSVWIAEQHQPVQRRVALKLIKPGMDSAQILGRFQRERQALALMDHPSIAKVFDAGTTPTGRPYFVMELVQGISMTKYCNEQNLPIRERLALFVPVCQAIQHAHQKGIIHRDIKPSNVLVCMQDGRPVPKVIDFGVAKPVSQQPTTEQSVFTEFGAIVGTLEYMAPEQAEVSPLGVDTRADVYALGAMLYELLTGTTPLGRQRLRQAALAEVLRIIKEVEPPRPSTRLSESTDSLASVAAHRHTEPARLLKEVRGELDWITMKCLEKDRTRRYETANGLARDVERYLADEPVEACPPSRSYRLGKFARKYRGALSAAATFVFLLAIATAVSASLAVRARAAEGLAQTRLEDVTNEKARADEEARIAWTVNKFLQDLVGQADIGNQPLLAGGAMGRDPNVTVRELLDRAARDIEDHFAEQPLTEMSIRKVIGDAYRALGLHAEAKQHLQRAFELAKVTRGADHLDTLHCKSSIANLHYAQGQYIKAEPLYTQVLERTSAQFGIDHPETLRAKQGLANLYQEQGKYTTAESLFKEVLEERTAKLGADHPETLNTRNSLAAVCWKQGQYARAEPIYKEVLKVRTAKLGDDHPSTLTTQSNLALMYLDQAQYAKAEQLFNEALAIRTAKLGADHPDTLISKECMAYLYKVQGQYIKAEPIYKEVLEMRTAKLGADHPLTLNAKHNLATLYHEQEQFTNAEQLFKEVLQGLTAKLGANHPDTLASKNGLAMVYRSQGQNAKAEQFCKELLEVQTVNLVADNPLTLAIKSNLALVYEEQGKYAQAEPLFKEVLEKRTANLGADHPHTLQSKYDLAGAYTGQKQFAKAEPLIKEVLEKHTASLGADHPKTLLGKNALAILYIEQKQFAKGEPLLREAVEGLRKKPGLQHSMTRVVITSLAELYEEYLNTPAKAEPLRRELAEFWKQKAGDDSAEYAGQLALLANNLLRQHKAADAEPILRQGLTIRQKKQPDAWTTFNTESMLGGALLSQKKYADAEPLLRQGYEGMKQRLDKIPPQGKHRLPEALERLVQLYEATGKKDEAASWRKELEEVKKPATKKDVKP